MENEEKSGTGKPKGYGFLMAGGVFLGGYVAYLIAKAAKLEKPLLAMAVASGLVVGAMVSGQALKRLEDQPVNEPATE